MESLRDDAPCPAHRETVVAVMSCLGDETEREKSMMYLTGVVQNRQGVSWIS